MKTTYTRFTAVVAALLLVASAPGCDDGETDPPNQDAAAETIADVAGDTAADIGKDTAPDVAPDTAPDVAPDTAPDVAPDTAPDVALDVASDTSIDLGPSDASGELPDDTSSPEVSGDATDDSTSSDVSLEDGGSDTTSDVVVDATDTSGDAGDTNTADVDVDTTPPLEPPASPWSACLAHCAALDTLTCSFIEVSKEGCDAACEALTQLDNQGLANAACVPKVQDLLTCIAENDPGYECDEELSAPGVGQACQDEFWTSLECFRSADSCNSQCDAMLAAGCAEGPLDKGKCMRWCHPAATQGCTGESNGLGACIGFPGTPNYVCNVGSGPSEEGCETYSDAFANCAGPQLP